jgi:hypothetical protein
MKPLRISDNGRYLIDGEGQPFFYLADTAWGLFTRVNKEDAFEYLMNRKAKGFTVIMPVALPGPPVSNHYGEMPLIDGDPTRLNEAYFRHVDTVIDKAAELGLWIALLPTWGANVGSTEVPGSPIFDTENAKVYGEFIGDRYRDRPIIWVLGGDYCPDAERYVEVWRAMAAGLRAGDGGAHPIAYHPRGGHSTSEFIHDEPWLDINMIQTSTSTRFHTHQLVLKDYGRVPVKPTLDAETRYENSHLHFYHKPPFGPKIKACDVRQAAYGGCLSGAMGHTYGCRDVWNFHVPDGTTPTRDVDTHWRKAMDFPGAFHLGHLKSLLHRYPWYELIPDQGRRLLVYGQCRDNRYMPAALSCNKDFGLIYVPQTMPLWVDLSVFGGGPVRAAWFDPREGGYAELGVFSGTEKMARFAPPPEDGTGADYVLVLEAGNQRRQRGGRR